MCLAEIFRIIMLIVAEIEHKVGENYMTKQNYFSVIKAYDELCRFSGLSSILSGFISVADQFYTDLLKEIEKLKRESKDIDIKEYDEWTNGDAVIYFLINTY